MVAGDFLRACRSFANRTAIVDADRRLTYSDLLRAAARCQKYLEREAGVRAGDIVVASLDNSWRFAAAFFAAAGLGAALAPSNPGWREREKQWHTARLRPRVVLDGSMPPLESGDDEYSIEPVPDDSPAAFLATSGSTGTPRIVPRSGRNLAQGAQNVAGAVGIGPGQRFLSVIPFHHSNGLHNCLIAPLLHGATVILMRNFSPRACAELIHREAANVLFASPFLFGLLADRVEDASLLSTLETCHSGGARMPEPTEALWLERTGTRVRQHYGSTETGAISMDRDPGQRPGGHAGGFAGKPIRGVEVRIVDGEILVRSQAVMSGYFGEPNDQYFLDGFFRTGDSGYLSDGGDLYVTGRTRRIINVAGVKVDPVEIERIVEQIPGVSACHADSIDGEHGANLIRVRIAADAPERVSRETVIAHCRARLAEHKLPRIVEISSGLPVTLTGKTPQNWSDE